MAALSAAANTVFLARFCYPPAKECDLCYPYLMHVKAIVHLVLLLYNGVIKRSVHLPQPSTPTWRNAGAKPLIPLAGLAACSAFFFKVIISSVNIRRPIHGRGKKGPYIMIKEGKEWILWNG